MYFWACVVPPVFRQQGGFIAVPQGRNRLSDRQLVGLRVCVAEVIDVKSSIPEQLC